MNQMVVYLCAVFGMSMIGVGAIVALEIARPGGQWNSQATYAIIGVITPTLTLLLSLVKSVSNGDIGKENAKKLDHLHTCVETKVGEVVAQAREAKDAAVETKQDVRKAINGGLPKKTEIDVTVHGDKP